MRIRKKTIIWFVLAAFFLYGAFSSLYGDGETQFPKWRDATYVEDAKVLPENEGKLVAISGHPEVLEMAEDPEIGVSFPSPFVTRVVDQLTYDSGTQEWTWKEVGEGKSDNGLESGHLNGRICIGDFELDDELISRLNLLTRDVMKEDFSEEELALMEEKGHLITDVQFWFSEALVYEDIDELTDLDFLLHPEWDGGYRVRWRMWEPNPEEGLTIVGIQKGNVLTYCEVQGTLSVKNKMMDEDAFLEEGKIYEDNKLTKYLFVVFAVIFVALGVKSILETKKEGGQNS